MDLNLVQQTGINFGAARQDPKTAVPAATRLGAPEKVKRRRGEEAGELPVRRIRRVGITGNLARKRFGLA
jgi:hypothetical protein